MRYLLNNRIQILALLFWSALFVIGCGNKNGKKSDNNDIRPTMESENLSITNYDNGRRTYKFDTPHMVRYEGKDTVYMIFDQGVKIETYDDSTSEVKSWLTAKYAIYRESVQIWEARDSVVALDQEGKRLYTDLLFWDKKSSKIYSTIETKVISGEESVIGVNGFQSNEDLSDIEFFNSKGRILVDTATNIVDTTNVALSRTINVQ